MSSMSSSIVLFQASSCLTYTVFNIASSFLLDSSLLWCLWYHFLLAALTYLWLPFLSFFAWLMGPRASGRAALSTCFCGSVSRPIWITNLRQCLPSRSLLVEKLVFVSHQSCSTAYFFICSGKKGCYLLGLSEIPALTNFLSRYFINT